MTSQAALMLSPWFSASIANEMAPRMAIATQPARDAKDFMTFLLPHAASPKFCAPGDGGATSRALCLLDSGGAHEASGSCMSSEARLVFARKRGEP